MKLLILSSLTFIEDPVAPFFEGFIVAVKWSLTYVGIFLPLSSLEARKFVNLQSGDFDAKII